MMIVSPRALDELKTIGLNKYERNLWAALLSRSASTAGELSDISNVPRSRCYDVLESLAEKGFIIIQPGKPMKYVAVPPREALERSKKKYMERAREMENKIDRLSKHESLKELEKLHKENIKTIRPEDLTGAIKGRYAMLEHAETMMKRAKKHINLVTTEAGLIELSETHGSILKKVSDSGIKIRIVTPVTKLNAEVVKNLSKYAQIRDMGKAEKLGKFLARIYSVDGEEVLMGLTDDAKVHPTQDIAFWTQSNHATGGLFEPVFELVWNYSKPLK